MQAKRRPIFTGILLMLCSAVCTCVGQLLWKLSAESGVLFLVAGLLFYGCGAVLMIFAFQFGELSVLHPMLSFGYVLSLLLGSLVLGEKITLSKVSGIVLIIGGLILLASDQRKEE